MSRVYKTFLRHKGMMWTRTKDIESTVYNTRGGLDNSSPKRMFLRLLLIASIVLLSCVSANIVFAQETQAVTSKVRSLLELRGANVPADAMIRPIDFKVLNINTDSGTDAYQLAKDHFSPDRLASRPERLKGLNPSFAVCLKHLITTVEKAGGKVVITDGYRSEKDQKNAQKTARIAAPPGTSMHEYGLAVDVDPGDLNLIPKELGLKTWKLILANAPDIGLATLNSETGHIEARSAFCGAQAYAGKSPRTARLINEQIQKEQQQMSALFDAPSPSVPPVSTYPLPTISDTALFPAANTPIPAPSSALQTQSVQYQSAYDIIRSINADTSSGAPMPGIIGASLPSFGDNFYLQGNSGVDSPISGVQNSSYLGEVTGFGSNINSQERTQFAGDFFHRIQQFISPLLRGW